jgi:hypothetical protein
MGGDPLIVTSYEYFYASFQQVDSYGSILLFTLHNSSGAVADAIL